MTKVFYKLRNVLAAADELRIPLTTRGASKKEILKAKNADTALKKNYELQCFANSYPKTFKKELI
jgi:hypothetical protein